MDDQVSAAESRPQLVDAGAEQLARFGAAAAECVGEPLARNRRLAVEPEVLHDGGSFAEGQAVEGVPVGLQLQRVEVGFGVVDHRDFVDAVRVRPAVVGGEQRQRGAGHRDLPEGERMPVAGRSNGCR